MTVSTASSFAWLRKTFTWIAIFGAAIGGSVGRVGAASFDGVAWAGEGRVEHRLHLDPADAFWVEASPDLRQWVRVGAVRSADLALRFIDDTAGSFGALFYRLEQAPAWAASAQLTTAFGGGAGVFEVPPRDAAPGRTLTNGMGLVFEITLEAAGLRSSNRLDVALAEVASLPGGGVSWGGVRLLPENRPLPGTVMMRVRIPAALAGERPLALAATGYGEEAGLVPLVWEAGGLAFRLERPGALVLFTAPAATLEYLATHEPHHFPAQLLHRTALWQHPHGLPTDPPPSEADRQALAGQFRDEAERLVSWARLGAEHPPLMAQVGPWLETWQSAASRMEIDSELMTVREATTAAVQTAGDAAEELRSGWRFLDLNHDNQVDDADAKLIFPFGAWLPQADVNRDGRRDIDDYWGWPLYFTRWDRTGDHVVSHADFTAVTPVHLPLVNTNAALALVTSVLDRMALTLPPDFEARVRRQYATNLTGAGAVRESVFFEQVGMSALVLRNLETARWCFARSYQLEPGRDAALSNLGFTLCESREFGPGLECLAMALALRTNSGPTLNNIGWIFARHGQLTEAESFYRQAVRAEPRVGQYHLNLGAVHLRQGRTFAAQEDFARASEYSPMDGEALVAAVASRPFPLESVNAYASNYERARLDWMQSDPENVYPPWESLSAYDRRGEIYRQIREQTQRDLDQALSGLREQTLQRMRAVYERIAPSGANARADLVRYFDGFPAAAQALYGLGEGAKARATELATHFVRKAEAMFLSQDQIILSFALIEAQRAMATHPDPNQARQAFEEVIRDEYDRPMADAELRLKTATDSASLDLNPDYRDWLGFASGNGFMAIYLAGISDPKGYGVGLDGYQTPEVTPPTFSIEPSYSIGIQVVQIEYNGATDEVKLQVGEGVIVAGTWSPKDGFGFQVGVGVDFELVPETFGFEAVSYLKFGSDGSIRAVSEGGPNLFGGKVQANGETVLRGATHEPVGNLPR